MEFLLKHWKKLLGLFLIAVVIMYILFLFLSLRKENEVHAHDLVDARNQLAELSRVTQESETTWSRLAQEREDAAQTLRETNSDLESLIQSRNEQISQLTTAVGQMRNIRVTVDSSHPDETGQIQQTQSDDGRVRIDFSQNYHDLLSISGYTLSNPSFADLNISWLRPINFTVVTTQTEDGGWRTYLSSDISDLQIGDIQTTVNPRVVSTTIQQQQSRWYDGFEIGLMGGVGTTGQSGMLSLMLGYDFGPVSFGIQGTGVVYSSGGEAIIGLYGMINPFDL
jgi:hypothetical protein